MNHLCAGQIVVAVACELIAADASADDKHLRETEAESLREQQANSAGQ